MALASYLLSQVIEGWVTDWNREQIRLVGCRVSSKGKSELQ